MRKLTKPQLARLREIANPEPAYIAGSSFKPATTEKLRELGLVKRGNRRIWMTSFPMLVTDAGRAALAEAEPAR